MAGIFYQLIHKLHSSCTSTASLPELHCAAQVEFCLSDTYLALSKVLQNSITKSAPKAISGEWVHCLARYGQLVTHAAMDIFDSEILTLLYWTWAPTSSKGGPGLLDLYVLGCWDSIFKDYICTHVFLFQRYSGTVSVSCTMPKEKTCQCRLVVYINFVCYRPVPLAVIASVLPTTDAKTPDLLSVIAAMKELQNFEVSDDDIVTYNGRSVPSASRIRESRRKSVVVDKIEPNSTSGTTLLWGPKKYMLLVQEKTKESTILLIQQGCCFSLYFGLLAFRQLISGLYSWLLLTSLEAHNSTKLWPASVPWFLRCQLVHFLVFLSYSFSFATETIHELLAGCGRIVSVGVCHPRLTASYVKVGLCLWFIQWWLNCSWLSCKFQSLVSCYLENLMFHWLSTPVEGNTPYLIDLQVHLCRTPTQIVLNGNEFWVLYLAELALIPLQDLLYNKLKEVAIICNAELMDRWLFCCLGSLFEFLLFSSMGPCWILWTKQKKKKRWSKIGLQWGYALEIVWQTIFCDCVWIYS